jgi:hypothetical protein
VAGPDVINSSIPNLIIDNSWRKESSGLSSRRLIPPPAAGPPAPFPTRSRMSTLNEYLVEKRQAIAARKSCIAAGDGVPMTLTARVRAEGRSGIRRIRIRDF